MTDVPCRSCGRPLRDPASRAAGIGPVCGRAHRQPGTAAAPTQLTIPENPMNPQPEPTEHSYVPQIRMDAPSLPASDTPTAVESRLFDELQARYERATARNRAKQVAALLRETADEINALGDDHELGPGWGDAADRLRAKADRLEQQTGGDAR